MSSLRSVIFVPRNDGKFIKFVFFLKSKAVVFQLYQSRPLLNPDKIIIIINHLKSGYAVGRVYFATDSSTVVAP
ncbi:hypothetical protein QFZ20_000170 [Flavobacterium sp. W4I14]|nr:hypothetical protein [Flavobacterium sp. W4I14]